MNLRRYKSHKTVEVGKITKVDRPVIFVEQTDGTPAAMSCPDNMFARYVPKPGDYLVRYDGGTKDEYLSFSPADKFENGYTELPAAE